MRIFLNYLPLLNYGPLKNKGCNFVNAISRKILKLES